MTDQEMTRLCAEALGCFEYPEFDVVRDRYDPLHDDDQAMGLVKKFRLLVNNGVGSSPVEVWHVQTQDDRDESVECQSLNRAIVECVAKMQSAKALHS